MQSKKSSGVAYILLAGLAWSFAGVLSRYVPWSGFTLAGCRAVVATLLLAASRGSFRPVNNLVTWLGAVGVAATSLLFMLAVKLTSAANAIVLQYAMPVFVVAYQALVRKVRPRPVELVVILVVLCGVTLCFCQGFISGSLLGNALSLCSAVTWAIVFLAARMPGCDPRAYSYQGNLLTCACLVFLPFDPAVPGSSPVVWLVAAALGLVLGLGYLFFGLGMSKDISPVTAAIVANVEPVLNPTWCFLLLGENPGGLSIAGALIVLTAVTVYSLLNARPAAKGADT